ncbi:MAG: aspartate aminotransferase [Parasphingorhabdus sp.]|jgi:aspartate aminotransferase
MSPAKLVKSKILERVTQPAAIVMTQLGRDLKAQGHDIISLSIGEPDFDTPQHVKDSAYQSMLKGGISYSPVSGIPELKDAIREKFRKENQIEYQIDEVMVSAGGKLVLANALYATLNDGDEVIIPTPYWIAYHQSVTLYGGVPVEVQTSQATGFKLTPAMLEQAITDKTKWLVINSPGNPSGAVYSREELAGLAEVLAQHSHVWILSDDMYEHLTYCDNSFFTMAQVAPHLKDRTLTLNGVSKAYAMTGWRVGYAGGPRELISAMELVQSQTAIGTSKVCQWAAVAALTGPQDSLVSNLAEYRKRRQLVVEGLNTIPGLSCLWPDGAFYAYPGCEAFIGGVTPAGQQITNDKDFCMALLREQGVTTVHGAAFGLSPYLRVSYAASEQSLQTALQRISTFCDSIKRR